MLGPSPQPDSSRSGQLTLRRPPNPNYDNSLKATGSSNGNSFGGSRHLANGKPVAGLLKHTPQRAADGTQHGPARAWQREGAGSPDGLATAVNRRGKAFRGQGPLKTGP